MLHVHAARAPLARWVLRLLVGLYMERPDRRGRVEGPLVRERQLDSGGADGGRRAQRNGGVQRRRDDVEVYARIGGARDDVE